MSYELYSIEADKRVLAGFESEEMARLVLRTKEAVRGFAVTELGIRLTPKRVKPPTYALSNVLTTKGENLERERAYILNPLGIVPYTVRTKENAGILLRSINGYNHEVGKLRLEVVELTDDGYTLRHMLNPGAYQGTWTLWLKCNDLRALIALGRDAESEIYAQRK